MYIAVNHNVMLTMFILYIRRIKWLLYYVLPPEKKDLWFGTMFVSLMNYSAIENSCQLKILCMYVCMYVLLPRKEDLWFETVFVSLMN